MSSDTNEEEIGEEEEEEEEEDEDDEEMLFSESSFFLHGLNSASSSFELDSSWQLPLLERSTVRYTPLLSLFENLFTNQMDRFILDEVSSESMSTYHQELLRRNEDIVISTKYPVTPFVSTTHRNHHCFICMEDLTEGEDILLLECQHVYHPPCIQNAIMYNPQCPLCRGPIEFEPKKSE